LKKNAPRHEASDGIIKKKRGRGKREIVLLSVLAVLVLLILLLYGASSSRAEETAAQKEPAKTQQAPATPRPATQQPAQATTPAAQAPAAQVPQPPTPQQRIDALRAKIAADSLNAQLHYELANALHDADKREEALVEYDKALAINPEYVEALVNEGAVLNELGNISEAINTFKRALALKPGDPRALCNLGNSFYAVKDYSTAMKDYELAVKSDSTFVEGYYYIGIAFADAGIYREAVREWEKIVTLAPNSEAAKTARENIDALKNFMTGQ